ELERILPEPVLPVARGLCAFARSEVVAAKEVQERGLLQPRRPVDRALRVDEQWKADPALLAERARVADVTEPDRRETGSRLAEFRLVRAQLRGVLAAEDSAVVPQEDDDGRR